MVGQFQKKKKKKKIVERCKIDTPNIHVYTTACT
jgi:hypothetical protein